MLKEARDSEIAATSVPLMRRHVWLRDLIPRRWAAREIGR